MKGGDYDGLRTTRNAAAVMAYTCRGYANNESIMGWFGREKAEFFLCVGKTG